MKLFFLLTFISLSASASFWEAGDYKIKLTQNSEGDWLSQDCLKNCKIDEETRKNLKSQELSALDLAGGMNPGSVLCKRINGKVIYLKFETTSQAFCSLGSSVVSLSRLIRLI